jgi:hypothetical protein
MWIALATFLSSLLGSFLLMPKPRAPRAELITVRAPEPFSWEKEYRRLWHNGPSAFWLEPGVEDVRKMIAPHIGLMSELGRRLRRIRSALDQLEGEMGTELLLEIAAVSRELDAVEEAEELPVGWGDRRFNNQIAFNGFASLPGGRVTRLERGVPLPVYRVLKERGLSDGYRVLNFREDLLSEEMVLELERLDDSSRRELVRLTPHDLMYP